MIYDNIMNMSANPCSTSHISKTLEGPTNPLVARHSAGGDPKTNTRHIRTLCHEEFVDDRQSSWQ